MALPRHQITRITNDSKRFRSRGEGSLPKSIRIQIHENSGDASLVAYNGHENILNARVNEIPSLVHGKNDRVVVAQLFDAAFYKDGIFRRFYLYFSDSCDAQKFCKLYNREASMVRTIKKLKDSLVVHSKMSKPDVPVCNGKGGRKGLDSSSSSFSNEVSSFKLGNACHFAENNNAPKLTYIMKWQG
jgi:hypothetical protein